MRAWVAGWQPRLTQFDPRLGWRHVPGATKPVLHASNADQTIRLNEYGHRGPAHPPARTPGQYRILVLGDSYVEGLQVGEDELFTALLERVQPDLEVINAGVGSYGTVQEYLYLRDEGLRFSPDLVLLMFFFNDGGDSCLPYAPGLGPRPYATLADGAVRIVEQLDPDPYLRFCMPLPFRGWLAQHSMLYRLISEKAWQVWRAEALAELEQRDLDALGPEYGKRVFTGVLRAMRDLLRARGIDFAVGVIPGRNMVVGGDPEGRVADVAALCQDEGVPCLPLLEAMVAATTAASAATTTAGGGEPYFDDAIHWTPAGHRVAARELERFVRELRGRRAQRG